MSETPAEVRRHYESEIVEADRLLAGAGQLELVRTQEIVRRHLPGGPLHVLDVGGGAGVHARWLAGDGHSVHLIDPVPNHVDAATALGRSYGGITAALGDARHLDVDDSSCDAVLLLGPMYHLTDRDDRLRALREARRVVRPGGPVFVGAISRFASLVDGLCQQFLFDSRFRAIVEQDLRDGQHRNPSRQPGWFTTAYFHHPDELGDEASSAGLTDVEVLGVEGVAGWFPALFEHWEDPARRDAIAFAARSVEVDRSIIGASPHLLMVARRPER